MALCLFSYLGVETAAVAAAKVRDPDKNVPARSSARSAPRSSTCCRSPRSSASSPGDAVGVDRAVRHRRQRDLRRHVGRLRDVGAGGHLRLRRAQRLDHDLRRDAAGRGQGRAVPAGVRAAQPPGVPAFGIISSTALASMFMIMSYAGSVGITVFNTLVFMSGITAAIPYAFSASPRSSGGWSTTGSCTRRGSCATSASPSSAWSSPCSSSVLAQHGRGQLLDRVPAVHLRRRRVPRRHPDLPQAPDLDVRHRRRSPPGALTLPEGGAAMPFHVDSRSGSSTR